jgi:hypothetical protein
MNKLIELLNEYDPYIQSDGTYTDNFWRYVSQWHSAVFPKEVWTERIISKSYGFIKRLVDNDKIQKEWWICPRKDLVKEIIIEDRETNKPIWYKNAYTEYEQLLMYLAIQDEPLTFLIRILK